MALTIPRQTLEIAFRFVALLCYGSWASDLIDGRREGDHVSLTRIARMDLRKSRNAYQMGNRPLTFLKRSDTILL